MRRVARQQTARERDPEPVDWETRPSNTCYMSRYKVTCETCSYEAEAASVAEALSKERAHKGRTAVEHRMMIERRTES